MSTSAITWHWTERYPRATLYVDELALLEGLFPADVPRRWQIATSGPAGTATLQASSLTELLDHRLAIDSSQHLQLELGERWNSGAGVWVKIATFERDYGTDRSGWEVDVGARGGASQADFERMRRGIDETLGRAVSGTWPQQHPRWMAAVEVASMALFVPAMFAVTSSVTVLFQHPSGLRAVAAYALLGAAYLYLMLLLAWRRFSVLARWRPKAFDLTSARAAAPQVDPPSLVARDVAVAVTSGVVFLVLGLALAPR